MTNISIIILVLVFILTAIRQVGDIKLQIWQVMLGGAIMVLLTGQITLNQAWKSINPDVMIFLFGMFVIGVALEESGYLTHLSYQIFRSARNGSQLLFQILFFMGIASAFLMNDTIAIIGTPIMLQLAQKHRIDPKILLLTLAFSVTIGSVMSPIGNPQNLLIAIEGRVENGFVTFFQYLLIPTLVNLGAAFFLIKYFSKKEFTDTPLNHLAEPIRDQDLAHLSRISLLLLTGLIMVKIGIVMFKIPFDFKLIYIALLSALPIVLFSQKRMLVLKKVDWHTLLFFAAMFVLMQSVWNTGFFQRMITSLNVNIISLQMILLVSVLLSQLISNVPLVALYLPMLTLLGASSEELMTLAAGSTIAGNLFILGAASNVIIIQNAEKRTGDTLTFFEFSKIGIPLTLINLLVYLLFFIIF